MCELLGVPTGTLTRKSKKLILFRGALKEANLHIEYRKTNEKNSEFSFMIKLESCRHLIRSKRRNMIRIVE